MEIKPGARRAGNVEDRRSSTAASQVLLKREMLQHFTRDSRIKAAAKRRKTIPKR